MRPGAGQPRGRRAEQTVPQVELTRVWRAVHRPGNYSTARVRVASDPFHQDRVAGNLKEALPIPPGKGTEVYPHLLWAVSSGLRWPGALEAVPGICVAQCCLSLDKGRHSQ